LGFFQHAEIGVTLHVPPKVTALLCAHQPSQNNGKPEATLHLPSEMSEIPEIVFHAHTPEHLSLKELSFSFNKNHEPVIIVLK
jgi:hypothetical protein